MSAQTVLQNFRCFSDRVSHALKFRTCFYKVCLYWYSIQIHIKGMFQKCRMAVQSLYIPLNLILQVKINRRFIFIFVISADGAD